MSRYICVVVMKKIKRTIAGHVFSQSGTEIIKTYPINTWSIYFTPILGIAGRKKVTCRCTETVKR